jgi:hypothetical protein
LCSWESPFRELPGGRSRWRLPQSRDRELQGSTHCGYCVHGPHLLSTGHDPRNDPTPATRCTTGTKPVAVSPANAPPTATPSSVKSHPTPSTPSTTSAPPTTPGCRLGWREERRHPSGWFACRQRHRGSLRSAGARWQVGATVPGGAWGPDRGATVPSWCMGAQDGRHRAGEWMRPKSAVTLPGRCRGS